MNRIKFFTITMGVLLLQSCVSYRIKVVEHKPNVKYYFPQKRVLLGEWDDLSNRKSGSYTYEWARKVINDDMQNKEIKPKYIK